MLDVQIAEHKKTGSFFDLPALVQRMIEWGKTKKEGLLENDFKELIDRVMTELTAFVEGKSVEDLEKRLVYLLRGIKLTNAMIKLAGLDRGKEETIETAIEELMKAQGIGSTSKLNVVSLADVDAKAVEWLWPFRIPKNKFTLFAGPQGIGKGFFTLYMAAQIAKGEPWPDCADVSNERGGVLLLTAEDALSDTVAWRLENTFGLNKESRRSIEAIRCVTSENGTERLFNLGLDLKHLESLIQQRRNIRLIIIDPINSYWPSKKDSNRDSDVRSVLAPITAMAERCNVSVIGLMHLNKRSDASALDRILNSVAFSAVARTVWIFGWDKRDDVKDEVRRRDFVLAKCNSSPYQPGTNSIVFTLSQEKGMKLEEFNAIIDANEMVKTDEQADEEKKDIDVAIKFLQEVLEGGEEKSAKQIIAEAKQNGISLRTLMRAKRNINIRSRKHGGSEGYWVWKLPVDRVKPPTV